MARTYTVLVVDEEADGSRFESWLSGRYEVKTERTAIDALEDLAGVDVALLEGLTPSESGARITASIDRQESDRVTAIVAAVDPDGDGLDVHCSESLSKPVTETALLETVDRLRRCARYDDRLAAYADLAATRGAIEATRSPADLADDPGYASLCRRLETLRSALDGMAGEFDEAEFRAAFESADFVGEARVQRVRLPA